MTVTRISRGPIRVPVSGRVVAAAGFAPAWLALTVLVAGTALFVPAALSGTSMAVLLPLMTFLAVTSLGQMLVVMTGGIDLSAPSTMTLVGTLVLGLAGGDDDRVLTAVGISLVAAAGVGLANGLLIGYLELNPLVVTIAVGQIVLGIAASYRSGLANETAVPGAMSDWAADRVGGISTVFWVGALVTVAVAIVLNRSTVGRRFQAVGTNREAAFIAGIGVRRHVIGAYVAGAILFGLSGLLLAAFIRSPTLDMGTPYLLGPIAVVVIAGASLAGGLASATSTWVAAAAIALLTQVLRVSGLPSSLQYVVFGCAIAAGMVISGDRIVSLVGSRTAARRAPVKDPDLADA